MQTIEIKANDQPWYDFHIKNKTRERDVAYKNFKKCDITEKQTLWLIYKQKRNEVVNLIKQKRKITMKKR